MSTGRLLLRRYEYRHFRLESTVGLAHVQRFSMLPSGNKHCMWKAWSSAQETGEGGGDLFILEAGGATAAKEAELIRVFSICLPSLVGLSVGRLSEVCTSRLFGDERRLLCWVLDPKAVVSAAVRCGQDGDLFWLCGGLLDE